MDPIFTKNRGVTLLFEHSPSQTSEIDYFVVLVTREKINLPNDLS